MIRITTGCIQEHSMNSIISQSIIFRLVQYFSKINCAQQLIIIRIFQLVIFKSYLFLNLFYLSTSDLQTKMLAFGELNKWGIRERQLVIKHFFILQYILYFISYIQTVQCINNQFVNNNTKNMKSMTVSLQNQKRALQLKYLISTQQDTQNKQQLINTLNKLHPFTQYPLSRAPPLQLFQTHEQQLISTTLSEQLNNHSFIVITGGLIIKKGQHTFIQNQFLSASSQQEIIFNIRDQGVQLKALPNTCYIKIHNIWINMTKKKQKQRTEDFIKQKLLEIPFFANLSFQQFQKVYKAAYMMLLGPGDILLQNGVTPYNMYIVVQGELNFQRKVKLVRDNQLWIDVINQLQRKDDDTCEQMFNHLVKNPRPHQQTFQVLFVLKNINENEIICAKETLNEQKITYDIVSSLKTKLICLKYPDFYSLSSDRLADIRIWPSFSKDNIELRKDYYYQMKWQDFKQQAKRQTKLNKIQKQKFEDFLRKAVNLSQQKHYYCPYKIGEGNIIDSPASKVSRLKSMTYQQAK